MRKSHLFRSFTSLVVDRRGPASLRESSAMNSRELAADVPLATQESDEDDFEVGLAVSTYLTLSPHPLVC